MNPSHRPHLRLLMMGAVLILPHSQARAGGPTVHAGAEAVAGPPGAAASSIRRSMSVTSDGKTTIRKTTTVRDGVEETIIETTGPDGKTTTTRELAGRGGDANAERPEPDAAGPRAIAGLRVVEASAVLREQLGLGADEGLVVDLLDPEGPAAAAGILVHDILLKVDDRPVGRPAEFRAVLRPRRPGDEITVSLLRKGRPVQARLTLAAAPQEPQEEPAAGVFFPPGAEGGIHANGFKVEIRQGGNEALERLLNDPDVPENLKEMLRKSAANPAQGNKR